MCFNVFNINSNHLLLDEKPTVPKKPNRRASCVPKLRALRGPLCRPRDGDKAKSDTKQSSFGINWSKLMSLVTCGCLELYNYEGVIVYWSNIWAGTWSFWRFRQLGVMCNLHQLATKQRWDKRCLQLFQHQNGVVKFFTAPDLSMISQVHLLALKAQ